MNNAVNGVASPVCTAPGLTSGVSGAAAALPSFVFAFTEAAADLFPALSNAATSILYSVFGASFTISAVRASLFTVPIVFPFTKISYPATPTLSLDAFHSILTVVSVVSVTFRSDGADGASLSGFSGSRVLRFCN